MTSGGKRKGSGRKLKYGEPTEPVVTKVPKSKKQQFKTEAKKILKKWEVNKKTRKKPDDLEWDVYE
jgi:hypothetical protein